MTLTVNPHILNSNLYNVSSIQIQAYQQRLRWPWRRGNIHALGWVIFMCGFLFIFTLINVRAIRVDRSRLKIAQKNRENRTNRKPKIPFPERSTLDRISTHLRSMAYYRNNLTPSLSVGLGALIVAGFAFPLIYIFTQHPYYAMFPSYGPPPLAGRSGMMAVAMIPFVLALGMKANLVSFITGVGHEKLNVLHRWLSFLLFILSIVHGAPFIVEPVVNTGWGEVSNKFKQHPEYWSGAGALLALFWLCFASLPFIRALCYEFFVHVHILAGAAFIGLMLWHCNNQLTSWHYLFAAIAIWISSLVYRLIFCTNLLRAIHGEQAHFTPLTDNGVMITIPTTLRWHPGQHVFIRIPSINPFDNHPFTVASVAERPKGQHNDLVLVFKPFKGFTKRVYDISRNNPDNSYRVFLDGPYGGLSRKLESFETVLLIAGGSGITPMIAHLKELARKIRSREAVTRDVRIIWTVKRFDSLEWFKDAISEIARSMPRNSLLVQYFITRETPVPLPTHFVSATRDWPTSPVTPIYAKPTPFPADPDRGIIDEKDYEMSVLAMQKELGHTQLQSQSDSAASSPVDTKQIGIAVTSGERSRSPSPPRRNPPKLPPLGDEVMLEFGRPPLRKGLREWAEGFGRRACVYVCGPTSMKIDVANAVAEMQTDCWMSDEREEIYLHTETFGW